MCDLHEKVLLLSQICILLSYTRPKGFRHPCLIPAQVPGEAYIAFQDRNTVFKHVGAVSTNVAASKTRIDNLRLKCAEHVQVDQCISATKRFLDNNMFVLMLRRKNFSRPRL